MAAKKKKNDSYFNNLGKEFAQFMKARELANDREAQAKFLRSRAHRSLSAGASATRASRDLNEGLKKERNAKGQLAGALLQGRKYKGNKQVKNSTKKK
jgi:hypothetical protein